MRKEKKAIFSGDFDPFHIGHAYAIEKSLELIDKVLIYVSRRKLTGYTIFADWDARINLIKEWIRRRDLGQRVEVYAGDRSAAELHAEGYEFKICGTDHLTKKLLAHLRHMAPFKVAKSIILVKRLGYPIEMDMLDYFLDEGKTIHIVPSVGEQMSSSDILDKLKRHLNEGSECVKGMVPEGMEKLVFDVYSPFADRI